jgi:hypothetical protein
MCTIEMLKLANNEQGWTQSYKNQLVDGKLELSRMQSREKKRSREQAGWTKARERLENLLLQKNDQLQEREEELQREIAELKKEQTAIKSTRLTPTETRITKESGKHLEGRQSHYAIDRSDALASSNDRSDTMCSTISTKLSKYQNQMPAASSIAGQRRMDTYDYSSSDDGEGHELKYRSALLREDNDHTRLPMSKSSTPIKPNESFADAVRRRFGKTKPHTLPTEMS